MANFAERLKEIADTRGVAQRWLANAAGTTEATISRYTATGQYPAVLDSVILLAKNLDVSTDYLLGVTDLPRPIESLTPDVILLNKCYGRMTESDKLVLWALLDRYIAPIDKKTNPYIHRPDDETFEQ